MVRRLTDRAAKGDRKQKAEGRIQKADSLTDFCSRAAQSIHSISFPRHVLYKPGVESGNLLAGFFEASGAINDEVGAPELFLDG